MKKKSLYYLFFLLSFIMYSVILFAVPYVTAQLWADITMYIFIVAIGYQLIYLFYLRKKDNLKFGGAVALYFLCLFISLEMFGILYYVDLAVNGYTPTDFLGNQIGETVYGWTAIGSDGWANYILVPFFLISILYQAIYMIAVFKKGRK
ncbi:MAG: hypothetical protein E7292_01720 [Lachnospiraceae bacterium]|nr:hypothetical protein [Lachnospiraceae bacterium]